MNWYGNYSRRFRAYDVSASTWEDLAEFGKVESLDIANDVSSDAIQDGTAQIIGTQPDGLVRIYIEADGDGGRERVAVATMRKAYSERAISGATFTARVDLESVLANASNTKLETGYFAPRGADPVRFASVLLRDNCECPVEIGTSGLELERTIVAENGETVVSFCNAVLFGTGYRVRIDGFGNVRISGDDSVKSLDSSMIYADGITDKTEGGVRTITYSRPYDPAITEGSIVSLFVPEHGIAGNFTVMSQRINDDCVVQEEVAHAIA